MNGERGLQQAVFEYLRLALPDGAVCFAVPNGDGRATTMPGALAGVPDICIVFRGRPIFTELKTQRGAVRPSQRFVHDRLTLAVFERLGERVAENPPIARTATDDRPPLLQLMGEAA